MIDTDTALFARMRFAECDPTTGLFLSYIPSEDVLDGTTRTDGTSILHAPDFKDLARKQQVGTEIHLVAHVVLRHVQRGVMVRQASGAAFNSTLWNIVCDGIVASMIHETTGRNGFDYMTPSSSTLLLSQILLAAFGETWKETTALQALTAETLYGRILSNTAPNGRSVQGDAAARVKILAAEHGWTPDMVPLDALDPVQEAATALCWHARLQFMQQISGKEPYFHFRHVGLDGQQGPATGDIFSSQDRDLALASIAQMLECPEASIAAHLPTTWTDAARDQLTLTCRLLTDASTQENCTRILDILNEIYALDFGTATKVLAMAGVESFFARHGNNAYVLNALLKSSAYKVFSQRREALGLNGNF